MKEILLVYETDAWRGNASRNLIAAATTEQQRDRLVRKFLRENYYQKPSRDLIDEAVEDIRSMGQTQCLSDLLDIEIVVEKILVDEIVY